MGSVFGFVLLAVLAFSYLLPMVIAHHRGHRSQGGIALVTIFLGWTLIGWFGALLWSVTGEGQAGMRACPRCAEMVKPAATGCRHCGADLAHAPASY
jgi:hypothetical protein